MSIIGTGLSKLKVKHHCGSFYYIILRWCKDVWTGLGCCTDQHINYLLPEFNNPHGDWAETTGMYYTVRRDHQEDTGLSKEDVLICDTDLFQLFKYDKCIWSFTVWHIANKIQRKDLLHTLIFENLMSTHQDRLHFSFWETESSWTK